MKTKQILILTIVALLALPVIGCAAKESPVTTNQTDSHTERDPQTIMEEIGQANRTETLFKSYESVYKEHKEYASDGTLYTSCVYVQPDFMRERSEDYYFTWTPEEKVAKGYDFTVSAAFYTVSGVNSRNHCANLYESPVFGLIPEEEVENIVEENGKLIVTTVTPPETVRSLGREIADDEVEVTNYTVDAETLFIEGLTVYIRDASGTETLYAEETVSYDGTMTIDEPEEYTAAFDVSDLIEVNVVFDPGTDGEQVFSAKIPVDVELDIDRGAEYQGVYHDAECTDAITIKEAAPSEYAENGVAMVYLAKGK